MKLISFFFRTVNAFNKKRGKKNTRRTQEWINKFVVYDEAEYCAVLVYFFLSERDLFCLVLALV